jgi:hypothetical protein
VALAGAQFGGVQSIEHFDGSYLHFLTAGEHVVI